MKKRISKYILSSEYSERGIKIAFIFFNDAIKNIFCNSKYMLVLALVLMIACGKPKSSDEDIEIAKMEQDSIIADVVAKDTLIAEIVKTDPKIAKLHKRSSERIEENMEKSDYKDVPCTKVLNEFKKATDDFCAKKISLDEFKKEYPI